MHKVYISGFYVILIYFYRFYNAKFPLNRNTNDNKIHYHLCCAGGRKMKLLKFVIPLTTFLSSNACLAGVFDLTMFSRANCAGVNESISWSGSSIVSRKFQFNLGIISIQTNAKLSVKRSFMEGYLQTWRLHAGCFFCGNDGWSVEGQHFADPTSEEQKDYLEQYCSSDWVNSGQSFAGPCKITTAIDCNLGEM